MATAPRQRATREIEYPTGDGKPMAETDVHRQDMVDAIDTLGHHFAHDPKVYVSGNLLLYYKERNRRKHVSPDVLVSFGVPKEPPRDCYLVWKEGKGPDVIIEITSKTTKREDKTTKWKLYRDVLKVPEYFQFDPTEDYLKPPLQGFRLVAGEYLPIQTVNGRLPSLVLGLHLERDGKELRLFDPVTGLRLLTARERAEAEKRLREEERRLREEERRLREAAEAGREEERELRETAEAGREAERQLREAAEAERQRIAEDFDRLRQELEAFRRRSNSSERKPTNPE
jgi:Uma2 family endonuclease